MVFGKDLGKGAPAGLLAGGGVDIADAEGAAGFCGLIGLGAVQGPVVQQRHLTAFHLQVESLFVRGVNGPFLGGQLITLFGQDALVRARNDLQAAIGHAGSV